MNGRFHMQGGKNWISPKEMNANQFFWNSHWLEIWSNHFCPSMEPNGGSVTMNSGVSAGKGCARPAQPHRNCRKKSLMLKDHHKFFMGIVVYLIYIVSRCLPPVKTVSLFPQRSIFLLLFNFSCEALLITEVEISIHTLNGQVIHLVRSLGAIVKAVVTP
jgi:hypothetical protein